MTVVLFLWFDLNNLAFPGPYGDEVLQAAPAAHIASGQLPVADGSVPPSSLVLFGHVWPFMVLSYLGPVKTYLLAGAFTVFGTSVEVMRATTVFCGLVGLIFMYLFAREVGQRLTAELVVLLVGLDTSYVIFSRHDWGPVVIAFLAKIAGLYLLAVWWHSPRRWWAAALAGLAFGLGLSHKADFAWLLLALVPVGIFYRPQRRLDARGALLAALGFLVGAAPLLYFNVESGGQTWASPGTSLWQTLEPHTSVLDAIGSFWHLALVHGAHRWQILLLVLDGRGVAGFIVRLPTTAASIAQFKLQTEETLFCLAIFVILIDFLQHRDWRWLRQAGAYLGLAGLIFAQIAVTPEATGPHHSIAVYPFPQLLIATGLSLLPDLGKRAFRRWSRTDLKVKLVIGMFGRSAWILGTACGLTLLMLTLGADLVQLQNFEQAIVESGGQGYWSDAINQAAAYIRTSYPGQPIQTLDWGLRDQLVMLLGPRARVSFWEPGPNPKPELATELKTGYHVFVLHSEQWTLFKLTRARFLGLLTNLQVGEVQKKVFEGQDHVPLVVVVVIRG